MDYDVLIIGAGLAGLTAALRLSDLGVKAALVDYALPQSEGDLGGFAKFSGAKFSLPPAGMGLAPLAGGTEKLARTIAEVLKYLSLSDSLTATSLDQSNNQAYLRSYQSILLTPEKITDLVRGLEISVKKSGVPIYRGYCKRIYPGQSTTESTVIINEEEHTFTSRIVIYAGGRLGTKILKDAGVETTKGKGIDVGVRVEFFSSDGLKALRSLGPDAKIIRGDCRTFCLNSPGEIYRYSFEHLKIPGGIVAGDEIERSNVGLLLRLEDKEKTINDIIKNTKHIDQELLSKGIRAKNDIFGSAKLVLDNIFGEDRRRSLEDFALHLQNQGLVNWELTHDIHLPLIDWHWDTFSKQTSFQTSEPAIYCIGDASGHARGLLQASISGYLVAEDISNEFQ